MGEAVLKSPGVSGEAILEVNAMQAENCAPLSGALNELRKNAVNKIPGLLRPQHSDELWRQTRPEIFPWSKLKHLGKVEVKSGPFTAGDTSSKDIDPPKGIVVLYGLEACEKFDRLISELLVSRSTLSSNWCAEVQLSALTSLTVVTTAQGAKVDQPILLSSIISQDRACSSLLVLHVPADSSLKVIDDCSGDDAFWLNRVEALIGPRAKLSFTSAQRLGNKASYLARHNFHLDRDSELESMYLNVGAQSSRLDLDLFLNQPGASAQLRAVTISDGKRHTDFHPTQHHLAPNCRSDLFSKGIATDAAHSVYYGYIRVAEGAQRTDAYQTNRNLVLSEKARADSIPNLEIKANDVRCSHGASVGHVNAEDMFYLMSRGLSRTASERLLVEGFIEDVLGHVKDPGLHDWLYDLVISRLDSKR